MISRSAPRQVTPRISLLGASDEFAKIATYLLSLPTDDPLRQSETMVHLLGAKDWARAAAFYGGAWLTEPELDGATRALAAACNHRARNTGHIGRAAVIRGSAYLRSH
jgi:hypothetical protein